MKDGYAMIIAVLLIGVIIIFVYAYKHSGDNVKCDVSSVLKYDAKIVNVSHKKVGLKGNYKIKTTVTFDDGFVFESHDTNTEKYFFYYSISVPQEMKNEIIKRAITAHSNLLVETGVPVPPKPFVCGKCEHPGPYEGNCPNCGSSMKIYL